MKKRTAAAFLALLLALCLTACGAAKENSETKASETMAPETEGTEAEELIVFAAASMTETLTEIGALYEAEHPGVKLVFNFDSSGTLKTQIQEGADCDVFVSAGQKQMNQLDKSDEKGVNTEGLDFVLEGTRVDLLENKVTLCVPEGNPGGIESFDDLAAKLSAGEILMAMGNSDVPVGQYTQKILAYYELSEEELLGKGVLTYGTNVKEVTTQVAQASVDCGIVYCTDAFSTGLKIIDYGTKEMCGQIIYPAAVMKGTKQEETAVDFLDFLFTDPAAEVFEKVGFSRI